MTPDLQLLALADRWEKDAKAYIANAPIPPGSHAKDITPAQRNAVNQAGLLNLCAHELRRVIKNHSTLSKKQTPSIPPP